MRYETNQYLFIRINNALHEAGQINLLDVAAARRPARPAAPTLHALHSVAAAVGAGRVAGAAHRLVRRVVVVVAVDGSK